MHDDPEVSRILDAIVAQRRQEWEAYDEAMRPRWEEQARMIAQVLADSDAMSKKIHDILSRWPHSP